MAIPLTMVHVYEYRMAYSSTHTMEAPECLYFKSFLRYGHNVIFVHTCTTYMLLVEYHIWYANVYCTKMVLEYHAWYVNDGATCGR